MKKFSLQIFLSALLLIMASCSDDDKSIPGYDSSYGTGDVPEVVSVAPEPGSEECDTINTVVITYNMPISIAPIHTIKINNYYADSVRVENGNQLVIYLKTTGNKTYDISIMSPTVHNGKYAYAPDYTFSFSTRIYNNFDASLFDLAPEPCNTDATEEARALYSYLLAQFGKSTLSATMALENGWSIDSAEKLYQMTGKYPAINSFDFMHLRWCPPFMTSGWVDISNMSVVEKWADEGGIVSMCWHWNVPKSQADVKNISNYAFYYNNGENTFSVRQAIKSGTWQNTQINEDLDVVASRLLELQSKGIAVLWRPLHEASGAWFWWGAEGAVQYKKLWVYMYNYFKSKGVNNLLWVWTSEGTMIEDSRWYPGEEYVDIIGIDYYDIEQHESIRKECDQLISITGGKKMVTLSECGAIPEIAATLDGGDVWSWFMPWNGEYMSEKYNSVDFFNAQMQSVYVISRDELPKLR